MRSTFHGIELAKRALYAQQTAINTTGHNVSNANTAGYSRQRVEMVTTPPLEAIGMTRSTAKGQLGTGVNVNAIVRLRDRFLDLQYRNENRYLGEWTVKENTYEKLEVIFNEIKASDDGFGTGLNRVFNDFWNAWQDLSRDPEKLEAKVAVVHRAVALADTFNSMARQLNTFEADLINNTMKKVDQANSLLSQIAELNQQIVKIHSMGQNANDLMDRRDVLVDELSGLISIEVQENELGGYQILLSGTNDGSGQPIELVSANGKNVAKFQFEEDTSDPSNPKFIFSVNGTKLYQIFQLGATGTSGPGAITSPSGEIFGYLDSIVKVQEYHTKLNSLVTTFVSGQITVDGTNYNGINGLYSNNSSDPAGWLFVSGNDSDPITASNIQLRQDLISDPENLKTTNDPAALPGDADLARQIAQLRNALFEDTDGQQFTLADYYNSMIGQLGIESQEAQRRAENHQLLVYQTDMLRQSVSGVSLDEEMANLVMFQHSYNAAARSLTVMDEMLDKLINGTGIVGR